MFETPRKKFVSAFKDKVRKTIRESGFTQTYMPYKKFLNEYLVSKTVIDLPKCDLGLPLPPKEFRSGYEENNESYLQSSISDVEKMMMIVNSSGFEIKDGMRVLDFGCSSGRMIRRLKNVAEKCEVWGTDVSADFIYWCNQYLNPPFHFATTTFNAHLPFEDKYFNFIYSGSVFTHIDNLIDAWLLELKRCLSENGRLYITIHDNHTIKLFEENNTIALSSYLNKNTFYENAKKDFDFFVMNRSKSPLVFFDIDYLKKILNPIFDIVSINPEAYGYQTGILLKRKN